MGTGNNNPLDELAAIGEGIDQVTELGGLKPLFSRLDQIAQEHSSDFDVQIGVSELKQKVVARGTALKQLARGGDPLQSTPSYAGPVAPLSPPVEPVAPTVPVLPVVPGPASGIYEVPTSITMSGVSVPPLPGTPAAPPSYSAQPPPPPIAAAAFTPNPPPTGRKSGRALLVGVMVGVLLAIAIVAVLFRRSRQQRTVTTAVAVQVATTPPGAAIRINGEAKCTANCSVPLVPGDYQVMAFLDGFEPAASTLRVAAGQPAMVNLKLEPQAQTVRVLSDLAQGQVTVDADPPGNLQDGQFVINKIDPGMHVIKVKSPTGEASFSVTIAQARAPAVSSPVTVRNLAAVLLSTLGNAASIVTNAPAKVVLNGQPQPDAGSAGTDLRGFRPGVNEIVVGEGKDQRSLSESFGPAPTLTVFLKSDLNIGTLIISAAEDDVRVFMNGKEYPRRTQRGQLRIQTIGPVNVRVAKDGFEVTPPQTAEVKKGSETRLEFKLQTLPKFAQLQLRDATPGAEIMLDQKPLGAVGADGTFTAGAVPPGDHVIELRRENYTPKRIQRQFMAGKTVALAGADVAMASALGSVRVTRSPADAAVVFRRAEETQARELRGNQVDLPPGNYIFIARAPGYADRSEKVAVTLGEAQPVDLALAKVVAAAPPPVPKGGGVADFADANAWTKQGDLWTHKGGDFIPYKLAGPGTYTFTVKLLHGGSLFRGGKIRWALQYMDGKNYDLFELDRKVLTSKVVIASKTYERGKYEHGLSDKVVSYTVQIEVAPEKLVTRLQDGSNWLILDTWSETGRNFPEGKFAFLVQGSDEIGLTDFKFAPR